MLNQIPKFALIMSVVGLYCGSAHALSYSCVNPGGKPANIQIKYAEYAFPDRVYMACFDTQANCNSPTGLWRGAASDSSQFGPSTVFTIQKPWKLLGGACWTTYNVYLGAGSQATLSSTGCTQLSGTTSVPITCQKTND